MHSRWVWLYPGLEWHFMLRFAWHAFLHVWMCILCRPHIAEDTVNVARLPPTGILPLPRWSIHLYLIVLICSLAWPGKAAKWVVRIYGLFCTLAGEVTGLIWPQNLAKWPQCKSVPTPVDIWHPRWYGLYSPSKENSMCSTYKPGGALPLDWYRGVRQRPKNGTP